MGAVKQIMFEEASVTADWHFPYRIIVPGQSAWDPLVDEVVLGMSPDFVVWDDYGLRRRTFPPGSSLTTGPFYQASSDSGDGVITLVDPNGIDIHVGWNTIRNLGPGSIAVGIQLRDKLTGARTTLLTGRLPLVDGVI